MTTRNDFDQLLASFLEDGATELSDGALHAVRAGIDRTRQRAVIGPWREPLMSNLTRATAILGVAVAVLVLGAVGLSGLPVATNSPSPSPAIGPSPTAAASPAYAAYTWPGPLQPATYATSFVWALPSDLAFTVPAGWEARDIEIIKGGASISVQFVAATFADPCSAASQRSQRYGEPFDLYADLVATPALDVSAASPATFAGAGARYFEYVAKAGVPCLGDTSALWALPVNDALPVGPFEKSPWPLRAGTHRVWILDDLGLVIDATTGSNPTTERAAEVQTVLDSFQFVPLRQARSIGSCELRLTSPNAPGGALAAPYTVSMSMTRYGINGMTPVDQFPPPRAHVDFEVTPSTILGTGDPGLGIVPPSGSGDEGYAVHNPLVDSGPVLGTFLFTGPGQWWVQIHVPAGGCYYQLPITVLPLP